MELCGWAVCRQNNTVKCDLSPENYLLNQNNGKGTTVGCVAGGQPDYSAQWADYYRSMGMHREADAIEQQAKGMKAAAAGGPGPNAAGPQQVGWAALSKQQLWFLLAKILLKQPGCCHSGASVIFSQCQKQKLKFRWWWKGKLVKNQFLLPWKYDDFCGI